MFDDFKQFVPSETCLQCDGCCRFKEEASEWRPAVTPEEIKSSDVARSIFNGTTVSKEGRLATVACKNGFACTFFNGEDNTCRVYNNRPFECRLYPFVLKKEGGAYSLHVHLICPHVQDTLGSEGYEGYILYLKGFFARKDVIDFLDSNKTIFNDYSGAEDELEFLFSLDI